MHLADVYPKRLTIAFSYTFFISTCSMGIKPTTFCASCRNTLPLSHTGTQNKYFQSVRELCLSSFDMMLFSSSRSEIRTVNMFCSLAMFLRWKNAVLFIGNSMLRSLPQWEHPGVTDCLKPI